jgi:maltose alpha-D-glucosyltransferase/alpha-amylase
MQLYNRGIRRRLAPMLGNDRQRIELAHSIMLTLPGTPVLRYGDEIGMGEDLSLEERDSIRTPMQWSDTKNGGFSTAPVDKLVLPVITGGEFGFERVNVAAQQRDPNSLLNWVERMTRLRMRVPEFGSGLARFLETSNPAMLAQCSSLGGSAVFALHNLSGDEIEAEVNLGAGVDTLFDLLSNTVHDVQDSGRHRFRLKRYGYAWLRRGRGNTI